MLLSLLKILLFFAVVLAIALGAAYLSENGHGLQLVYNGTEYTLGPIQLFVALLILIVISWAIVRLFGLVVAFFRFIAGDETAINRYFARSRERKGYQAVADGMLAVASGEGRLAQDKAAKAEKYLNKTYLTDVLAAQAAEVAGDTRKASEIYRRLLTDDRTRFVGIRGLMRQKLTEGDTATALRLAEKAYALKPRHRELQDTLLDLQTTQGDWKGARQTVREKRKQGQLPQDVATRRDAVLALQEASEILAEGNSIAAREAAIAANRSSPDLIPASVLAARTYVDQKDGRSAARVLEKTWSVRPHPALAAAYADIVPDENPAERLKRFEKLIKQNPNDEESRLLRAELLLANEDFPGARRALGDLATKHPTVRTLSIMAAIERGEGADDAVVRSWLTRALTASRGPQWVCDKCQNIMAEWAPICDNCGGFDTLTWREPEAHRTSAFTPAETRELVPLLTGASTIAATVASGKAETADKPAKDAKAEAVAKAPFMAGLTQKGAEPAAAPDDAVVIKREVEIANVPPGMVPRESDYVRADQTIIVDAPEPVMTVTDPDPASDASAPSEPAPKDEAPQAAVQEAPAKPVVQEPKPRRAEMVVDHDILPVRPDVEPIEDEFAPKPKKG